MRARAWIKHGAIYMMYSLKMCRHLTFKSNTNIRERRKTQFSLYPAKQWNKKIKKSNRKAPCMSIEPCWGWRRLHAARWEQRNQVNTNRSDITITIECDRGRQRAKKHLHLAESSRECSGIRRVAAASFGLITLKHTQGDSEGNAVSAGIMEIHHKV